MSDPQVPAEDGAAQAAETGVEVEEEAEAASSYSEIAASEADITEVLVDAFGEASEVVSPPVVGAFFAGYLLETAVDKATGNAISGAAEGLIEDVLGDPDAVLDSIDHVVHGEQDSSPPDDGSQQSAMADDSGGQSSMADDSGGQSSMADDSGGQSSMADDSGGQSSMADDPGGQSSMADDPGGQSSMADDPGGQSSMADDPGGQSSMADDPGGQFDFFDAAEGI